MSRKKPDSRPLQRLNPVLRLLSKEGDKLKFDCIHTDSQTDLRKSYSHCKVLLNVLFPCSESTGVGQLLSLNLLP